MRIASNSCLCPILDKAGYRSEWDVNEPGITKVYEFPILQGPAKQASEVSLWEQASNLIMMQREWSDNAVSNTLNFGPHEVQDIEAVLSASAPFVKSLSMMPHSDLGAYKQMPEEGMTAEQYAQRLATIKPIDWSQLRDDEITFTEPEKYCEGDQCLRKQ